MRGKNEEDILSVLISGYGSKPMISFLDAYSLKKEMRSYYFDFEIKVDIPYPSAEIHYSKMKEGYFYLNYIMGEKCKRYYFEINRNFHVICCIKNQYGDNIYGNEYD